MLKGKHQFGPVGGNVLQLLERRNNLRMLGGVIPCLGCINCCWMPSRVFDVGHMTGAPIATVVTEQVYCPPCMCCLPFLRPKTNVMDVSGFQPIAPGQPVREIVLFLSLPLSPSLSHHARSVSPPGSRSKRWDVDRNCLHAVLS